MDAFVNRCFVKEVVTEAKSDEQIHWHYCLISENYIHIDLGEYHTYGIQVRGFNFSEILHDVSPCKDTVVRMTEFFNKYQLSPIHLKDAVEDMLP